MFIHQQTSFRALLGYVWQKSTFYRDYYESHGIREKDLAEVAITDLPFITKQCLMENFDQAVTDPQLKKVELEQWIQDIRDPAELYRNDFVVVHSSGSSGNLAIFVYDRTSWQFANVMSATRLPVPEKGLSSRIRIATYLASHGHFAGVSTAALLPKSTYDVLTVSLLSPMDQAVDELNAFQPHRLAGYSSSVDMLAQVAIQGRLKIDPQTIVVGGDFLTRGMEQRIQQAWAAPVYEVYATSESICVGIRGPGQEEMAIMDELTIVEALDGADQPVLPGEVGRVVLTNLYNRTLPILRYELGDYVVQGKYAPSSQTKTIQSIQGRLNDALPVMLNNGSCDTIHPIILSEFYAQGLEKFQFVSLRPDHVKINYVAEQNIDDLVRTEFRRILKMKGAQRTDLDLNKVDHIPNDPKTGKFVLVKIQKPDAQQGFVTVSTCSDIQQSTNQVSKNFSGGFVEFDKEEIEQSIPGRFERQVAKYPDHTAVKSKRNHLTYNELNAAANRLAWAILEKCDHGQKPIALLLENGAAIITAIMGTLKAGKIYVPLAPSYPQARLGTMLEDSLAGLIITNNRYLSLASELAGHSREVMNVDELASSFSTENPNLPLSADTLAYILYTSGSTGEPKGVVQNHRNILHKTMTYTNDLRFCADDRIALLSPCTFSLSVGFIFGTLLNGACLYPVDVKGEGLTHLANWFAEEGITVYNSVPTVFRNFTETLTQGDNLHKLRLIHLGGEPVTAKDVELYKKSFSPECILLHHWGSNETGTIAQCFIDKRTPIHGNAAPAGRPGEGSEVLVLDEGGKPLGFNRMGEIAVKSRYLAVEYWRKPELTRAAFAPDPTGGEERIYPTGDLGLLRPDGTLEHYGRKDFQIKIRGQRVEVAEIEMALAKHGAIKEAVISVREDAPGDKSLVGYVVPAQKAAPTSKELRLFLQQRLPEYMVPSTFVVLDALPMTPNGKLDRQALPAPSQDRSDDSPNYTLPTEKVEHQLVQIWEKVLGIRPVGIDANFFDIGGHSLLLIKLHGELQAAFAVDIPMVELFVFPTISAQAEYLRQMLDRNPTAGSADLGERQRSALQRQEGLQAMAQRHAAVRKGE